MSSIPASLFANVIPGVLAPAGNALDTIGLMLTTSRRVPIGTVASFAEAISLEDFFGGGSTEATLGPYYFDGFINADAAPGALLVAQFPAAGAPAWINGGKVSGLTIPQLQGITGTLDIVVDGYAFAAAINLSAATSFSAAAALIEAALNATLPPAASIPSVGTSIAAEISTFTGSIAGNVLYVTTTPTTLLVPGAVLTGSGVTAGTQIINQLSGVIGGIGTYGVTNYQSVASESFSATWGLLTIAAPTSGTVSIGQTVGGSGVAAGTQVTALGTGQGLAGTYMVSPSQTIGAETLTTTASPLVVTYDSVSGGFVITSGQTGPTAGSSSMAAATGTIAAELALTAATGAILSQGALPQTPSAFMSSVASITQDWFSFFTDWDPDDANGNVGQNVQKLAFAQWTSQQKNTPYAYIAEDTDISPSETVPASSSLGQLIKAQTLSGTTSIWNPNGATAVNDNPFGSRAAFIAGIGGSINWEEVPGRITYAFKTSQAGLVADVTTEQVAVNLAGNPQNAGSGEPVGGNGYNYYGVAANASTDWIFFYPGSVSGPFAWLDAFIDQAFFNAQMQEDLMVLATTVKSIPYNPAGYALIAEALGDTIQQMINFGAIAQNVPLSDSQAAQVNLATGVNAAAVLSARGWYLQIRPAAASVRSARGSPPATFWYTDGGSISAFALNSVDVM